MNQVKLTSTHIVCTYCMHDIFSLRYFSRPLGGKNNGKRSLLIQGRMLFLAYGT